MAGLKKGFMLLVWRFQQVNSLVIIIGLSTTLTLQIFPYVGWRFVELGIPKELDWLIILIIFGIIFSGAIFVGIVYDSILKLWIQHQVVVMERNPYAREKIVAKGIINRQYFNIPMLRKGNLTADAEFNEQWVERNMQEDPILRKDVYNIIDWVNEYKLKPEDERWLKDLDKIEKKRKSRKKVKKNAVTE